MTIAGVLAHWDWSVFLISMGSVIGGWGLLDAVKDALTEPDDMLWGVSMTLLGIVIILVGVLLMPANCP